MNKWTKGSASGRCLTSSALTSEDSSWLLAIFYLGVRKVIYTHCLIRYEWTCGRLQGVDVWLILCVPCLYTNFGESSASEGPGSTVLSCSEGGTKQN